MAGQLKSGGVIASFSTGCGATVTVAVITVEGEPDASAMQFTGKQVPCVDVTWRGVCGGCGASHTAAVTGMWTDVWEEAVAPLLKGHPHTSEVMNWARAHAQTCRPSFIARYLTVGGAEVQVNDRGEAACAGCGKTDYDGRSLPQITARMSRAREWGQSHAEVCRALPRPEVA